jgi:hypothetical protein
MGRALPDGTEVFNNFISVVQHSGHMGRALPDGTEVFNNFISLA